VIKDLSDKITALNQNLKMRQDELNKVFAKESEDRLKNSEAFSDISKKLNEAKEMNLKLQISNQNLDQLKNSAI
jgi:hypothetical protein